MYRDELSKLGEEDVGTKQWATLNSKLIDTEQQLKTVDNLIEKIKNHNINGLANDFKEIEKNLQAVSKTLTSVGRELSKLSAATVGLGAIGVKYNADMEKYQVALTGMVGSAEEADKILTTIQEHSKTSSFGVSALVEANQLLISAGEEGQKSIDVIDALGNAIAATGGGNAELSRMAQNLQQVKNVGKASSMDIKQFANAGINIYGILSESTGKSVKQLQKMDITYEQLTQALIKASSEGGRYYGAMENQSQTLTGSIEKLKDSFTELLGQLTESLVPIIKSVIASLQEMTNKMKAMSPEQKETIVRIAGIVAAIGPLILGIGKITGLLGSMSGVLGSLLKNQKVVAVISKLIANGTSLGAVLKTTLKALKGFINPTTIIIGLFILLYKKCDSFREAVNQLGGSVWNLVKSVFTTLANILSVVFTIINQVLVVLGRLWQSFANSSAGQQFITFLNNAVKLISTLVNWLSTLVTWLGNVFKWFGDLIGIATDFSNVTGALTTKIGRNGVEYTLQSGGLMSDGMASNITVNNSFNISAGNNIDDRVVEHWADLITDRVNVNLGRLV